MLSYKQTGTDLKSTNFSRKYVIYSYHTEHKYNYPTAKLSNWTGLQRVQFESLAQKLSQHQSFPFYRPVPRPLDRVCLLGSKLCLWLGSPVRIKRIRQYSSSRTGLQHFKRIQWMRELAVVHVKTRDTLLNSTSKAVIMSSHPYPSLASFNDLLLWKPFPLLTWEVAGRISVFWWGSNRNFVSYRHLGWWKWYRGIFSFPPFRRRPNFWPLAPTTLCFQNGGLVSKT